MNKKCFYVFFPTLLFIITFAFNYEGTSVFFILSFVGICTAALWFINLNSNEGEKEVFRFKILSEDIFKIILIILMSSTLFIEPISSIAIINWDRIGILNYIRGFIFLIGLLFIPGACIYNIFFPKDIISKQLKVETFIVKMTLYPIFSLIFMGLVVLILDQLGFLRENIAFLLFIIIFFLFIFDFILKKKRNDVIKISGNIIKISKYNLILFILMISLFLLHLTINFFQYDFVLRDFWVGPKSAYYIGRPYTTPIYEMNYYNNYPIFWGYISFGLSILSGIPYINIDVMLILLSYLLISSSYLLFKAIFINLKKQYSMISIILLPTAMVLIQFNFNYKNFSTILLIISMTLFICVSKQKIKNSRLIRFRFFDFRIVLIASFLLVMSFITYIFPLIIGFLLLFLYCVFSEKNEKYHHFKLFSYFFLFFILFLIIIDSIMNFYVTYIIQQFIMLFFDSDIMNRIRSIIPMPILIYVFIFGSFFLFCILIQYISYLIYQKKRFSFKLSFKFNFKPFIDIIVVFFTITFIFFIIYFKLIQKSTFNFDNENLVSLLLCKIFVDFGDYTVSIYIGIIFVYLSYISIKKKKILNY